MSTDSLNPGATPTVGGPSRAGLWGLFLGPILALGVWILGPDSMSDAARATASCGTLMAVWWMTEALPLPATSLLPIALFPLLGVLPITGATAPYAHKFIFLFMGGFMLALAMERWGLHKRIALLTLLFFGTSQRRIVAGFMVATAMLSMWVSNTATTVMMLPVATSVLAFALGDPDGEDNPGHSRLSVCLLLGIAYAASIGGLATIIGTPPNVFLVSYLRDAQGIDVSFLQWMKVGLPLSVVFLFIAWMALTLVLYPLGASPIRGGRAMLRRELHALGRPSRGERTVLVVFVCTALAWIIRQPLSDWQWLAERVPAITRLDDSGIAIIAALALFIIPIDPRRGVFTLDWKTASRLPWGVLLLFGGGLSLAEAVRSSGLDAWIGDRAVALGGTPHWVVILSITALVIFLTELTSNTATAATFLPILGGAAVGMGIEPLLLVVPAALAASCAFMMPVATPPNAIVFGSGRIRIHDMLRAGLWLNLIGILLITLCAYTTIAWFLSAGTGP
jgi:sodium-dependent dicarboxylate transporter 2/3/5